MMSPLVNDFVELVLLWVGGIVAGIGATYLFFVIVVFTLTQICRKLQVAESFLQFLIQRHRKKNLDLQPDLSPKEAYALARSKFGSRAKIYCAYVGEETYHGVGTDEWMGYGNSFQKAFEAVETERREAIYE